MSRPGIEPGPPRLEASTLEKSQSISLYKWNLYMATPVHVAFTHGLILGAQARILCTGNRFFIVFTRNSTCRFFPPNNQVLASPLLNHVRVTTMKRLDQGHLYPKLEFQRLIPYIPARNRTWAAGVGGENSRKCHSNSLINCYSEPLQCPMSLNFDLTRRWLTGMKLGPWDMSNMFPVRGGGGPGAPTAYPPEMWPGNPYG